MEAGVLKYSEIMDRVKGLQGTVKLGSPVIGEIFDSGNKEIIGLSEDDFVVYAQIAVPYEGDLPEDHRVLNVMASDYVTDRAKELEASLHRPVLSFIVREYPQEDYSDILNGAGSILWEEQVDYMPLMDKENSQLFVTLELMLAMEEVP